MVYLNAFAPEALSITVLQRLSGVDLSLVTAASLSVRRPDPLSDTMTWSVSVGAKSSESIVLVHVFGTGEVSVPGRYVVVPSLTFASGVRRCKPISFVVTDIYS